MDKQKDSLVENFKVEETTGVSKFKVIFTTVNNVELIYYTNSKKFIDSLSKFKNSRFIIEYSYSEFQQTVMELKKKKTKEKEVSELLENRIVRVKLPKIKT